MTSRGLRSLIIFGTLLVLGAVNSAIVGKERIKRDGEVIYLPLEPVDPRSLLQGDYMALRFSLAREIERRGGEDNVRSHLRREGEVAYAAIALDERHVASLSSQAESPSMKLRYRIRRGRVWLGTNALFFEEGTAARFSGARYGEFRVDRHSGEAVLVGLRDGQLAPL